MLCSLSRTVKLTIQSVPASVPRANNGGGRREAREGSEGRGGGSRGSLNAWSTPCTRRRLEEDRAQLQYILGAAEVGSQPCPAVSSRSTGSSPPPRPCPLNRHPPSHLAPISSSSTPPLIEHLASHLNPVPGSSEARVRPVRPRAHRTSNALPSPHRALAACALHFDVSPGTPCCLPADN